jgi:hypothetical protein
MRSTRSATAVVGSRFLPLGIAYPQGIDDLRGEPPVGRSSIRLPHSGRRVRGRARPRCGERPCPPRKGVRPVPERRGGGSWCTGRALPERRERRAAKRIAL